MPKKTMTIDNLAIIIKESFDHVDDNFKKIDKRFEQVDKCFEQVDKRFNAIERDLSLVKQDISHLRHTADQIQGDIGEIKSRLTITQRLEKLEHYVFEVILKGREII